MPFEILVEVICFFSISTLAKLTETCRKFVNGVNYHPSVRNPHQMRSLHIAYYKGRKYFTHLGNTDDINQFLCSTSPDFLSGLCRKIFVDVAHMSSRYFQVNFGCKKLKEVKEIL